MERLTENAIEAFAIKLFERLGYSYVYAPEITPDSERPERSRYDEVLLTERLRTAVRRINPSVPLAAQQEAIKEVERIHSPELLANNEVFHRMLTEGVKVSYQQDGNDRGDLVWLIDFANTENNELEDGKKRYINEVAALSQAFAIAIPHEQAMDAKDEVAFFQAVKARLTKFDSTGVGKTNEEIETTKRQGQVESDREKDITTIWLSPGYAVACN